MLELQGIAVSPGVAIGKALILDREGYRITRTQIASADRIKEKQRLESALAEAAACLAEDCRRTTEQGGQQVGNIFSAHQQLLVDPILRAEWFRGIEEQCVSAEFAVSSVLSRYAQAFRRMGSAVMHERVNDIRDVERTLLEALGGAPLQDGSGDADSIVLSHDLTPRETANLDRNSVIGFVTEVGGPSSHTAIVARGLEIPAVVGAGPFLHRIESEAEIIVDGFRGTIIVGPDADTLRRYQERKQARSHRAEKLSQLRDLPAETTDGTRIQLLANIEFPYEVPSCLARGAEGVGLYRTEFLYLGCEDEPTEEQQFEAYQQVIQALEGRPVIMRTLDLGADKAGSVVQEEPENNPFLGLRSIRLSLRQPKLFRTQLRAMMRAANYGPLKVMFPMITTLHELRAARFVLRQVLDDMSEDAQPVPVDVQVGMMVEVPAAVLMLDRFVDEVDFISIGTNDLIQYTMAVDRGNELVADLYAGHDPAVLRILKQAMDLAQERGVECSVCGEMSSTPIMALLLVGLGARVLSAPPSSLPAVKQAIRSVSLDDCQRMARRAFELDDAGQIAAFLQTRFTELVPELALSI